jgi:HD superfamily phosphohydrolase YqeK
MLAWSSLAEGLEAKILQEEYQFPMIILQKIFRVIAENVFGIGNKKVLDAIECHTTLRSYLIFVRQYHICRR